MEQFINWIMNNPITAVIVVIIIIAIIFITKDKIIDKTKTFFSNLK